MMLNLYKPRGLTPVQTIEKFKLSHPDLAHLPMGYAGRLDPMAEGVLLVLVGEENKNQAEHLAYEKEYEVEILWGVETDSYDLLGLITKTCGYDASALTQALSQKLPSYVGRFEQAYPPYSAVRVGGKPLLWWARRDRLGEIEIPTKEREIKLSELLSAHDYTRTELETYIISGIESVEGNFRQAKTLVAWHKYFNNLPLEQQNFSIPHLRIVCSSGTYIRSLIHQLGHDLGTSATVLKLTRTRVGPYEFKDSENTY